MDAWEKADALWTSLNLGPAVRAQDLSTEDVRRALRERRVLCLSGVGDGFGGGSVSLSIPGADESAPGSYSLWLVFDVLPLDEESIEVLNRNAWDRFNDIPGWSTLIGGAREKADPTRREVAAALRELEKTEPRPDFTWKSLRLGPFRRETKALDDEYLARRVLVVECGEDDAVRFSVPGKPPPPPSEYTARNCLIFASLDLDDVTLKVLNENRWRSLGEVPGLRAVPEQGPPRQVSAAEIEALGVAIDPEDAFSLAARAIRDPEGNAIDLRATIARYRGGADYHGREASGAKEFAGKWGAASVHDITDDYDDHIQDRNLLDSAARTLQHLLALWGIGVLGAPAIAVATGLHLDAEGKIDLGRSAQSIRNSLEYDEKRLDGMPEGRWREEVEQEAGLKRTALAEMEKRLRDATG